MKLNKTEFNLFQKLIFDEVGIALSESKLNLVQSRLFPRLHHYKITSFAKYLKIVTVDHKEKIQMINLITTNETYFLEKLNILNF